MFMCCMICSKYFSGSGQLSSQRKFFLFILDSRTFTALPGVSLACRAGRPAREMDPSPLQVPVIDFSGVDAGHPGGGRWEAVRGEVMQALESFGCFEAVYEAVTRELRKALFGEAAKEVFGLPLGLKTQNKSDLPYLGYIGQIPQLDYESLIIDEAHRREGVEGFAHLMWPGPGGNPSFCDTVQSYSKQLSELDQIVRRMILESYGVQHDLESHVQAVTYRLRLSEYRARQPENDTVLPHHLDANLLSIICQHQIEGLAVCTKDGRWIHINPMLNSFTVLLGETIEAWTNGRLHPVLHQVSMSGSEPRYSAVLFVFPKGGEIVQAPEELVDIEHPALFKPFNFVDWFHFRFSKEGSQAKHALKAFCGISESKVEE